MEFQYDDITLYLKLLMLLYANEPFIFGTDEKDFQNNMMSFEYSELIWIKIKLCYFVPNNTNVLILI